MKLIGLADLHGEIANLNLISEEISSSDAVILMGDITHFGHLKQVKSIIGAISEYNKTIFTVPGNCDLPDVEDYLKEEGLSLHGRHEVFNGYLLAGAGASLPCPGPTPNEISEKDFETLLQKSVSCAPKDLPLILVLHQPPVDTKVDAAGIGYHVGSKAIRTFIEAQKSLLCFCGHIHEAVAIDSIGTTKIINPGPFRRNRYAYAELGDNINTLEIRCIAPA
jgi:Icc-related predicted phosphoesterase